MTTKITQTKKILGQKMNKLFNKKYIKKKSLIIQICNSINSLHKNNF